MSLKGGNKLKKEGEPVFGVRLVRVWCAFDPRLATTRASLVPNQVRRRGLDKLLMALKKESPGVDTSGLWYLDLISFCGKDITYLQF